MNNTPAPTISFLRHYYGFTGGHQKVRDYLAHFVQLGYRPHLHLENRTTTEHQLFDNIEGVYYQKKYRPQDCDAVFIAGMDWTSYLAQPYQQRPVINLIQHVRHADPNEPLSKFLEHPALRICMSDAIYEAISPLANGPCVRVKMGHSIPKKTRQKQRQLYILGNKQPALAHQLATRLQKHGIRPLVHDTVMPKEAVVKAMDESQITLALPHKTEGFYLPGIEAMALSNIAVIPDCVANREYCQPFTNALTCEPDAEAILDCVYRALKLHSAFYRPLLSWRGQMIARQYSMQTELSDLRRALAEHQLLPMR